MIENAAKVQSYYGRLFILYNCWHLFVDSPIFGVGGFGSFALKYPIQQSVYFSKHLQFGDEHLLADNIMYACNDYIQILCETGIIGGCVIVALLFFFAQKSKREVRFFKTSILSPLLVSAVFYYPFHTTLLYALFVVCVVTVSSQEVKLILLNKYKMITLALFLVTCFGCHYSINHLISGKILMNCIKRSEITHYQQNLILDDFGENKYFLVKLSFQRNRGLDIYGRIKKHFIHSEILYQEGKDLMKNFDFKAAEKQFLQASHICPNRFRYRYALFKLYQTQNDTLKSKSIAIEISKMAVKVNTPVVVTIKREIDEYLHDPSN